MTDVFISYAHEDHAYVRRMAPAFEAEGLTVWWDHTIPPGKTWDEVIAKGIADARCCIVLWSKSSVISDWVKEEATIAKDQKKFIPVQIDNSEPPVGFRRIQAAHLQNWSGDAGNTQWQMLVREVRAVIAASRGSGAPAPSHHARPYSPPPPPASSGPPPWAIGAMAVAAIIALIAVFVAVTGGNELAEAPEYAVEAPTEPAAEPAAPAVDPAAEQAAREQAARERREREAALNPEGAWQGQLVWTGANTIDLGWTLNADGTIVTSFGERGTWSRTRNGFRGTYRGGGGNDMITFTGRVSGNRISGDIASDYEGGFTGTFSMSR